MTDSKTLDTEPPSRSQKRREALDVLKLAHDMVALDDTAIARLDLDDDLLAHLTHARRISQHIARKREVGFFAKQLRRYEDELPHWRAMLDADTSATRHSAARLHRVEAWRDRLLRDGDAALGDLLEQHPLGQRQQLRNLLRQAQSEHASGKPPAAARALFKALRELLAPGGEAASDDGSSDNP